MLRLILFFAGIGLLILGGVGQSTEGKKSKLTTGLIVAGLILWALAAVPGRW